MAEALRHCVVGWDGETRYIDMTPEEEAEFEAGRVQGNYIKASNSSIEPTAFEPEPLPEPLEAAEQPDDDPLPRILQPPPAESPDDYSAEELGEPIDPIADPGPGWSMSELLNNSGPPPTPPAPPPEDEEPAPVVITRFLDGTLTPAEPTPPAEPEPPEPTPEAVLASLPSVDDPIAQAMATKAPRAMQVEPAAAPPPAAPSSVTHHFHEERTVVDETGWRAEVRYQVAVMAKNGSHKARTLLVNPAKRRGMTVDDLAAQIIEERFALEQKVMSEF